MSFGPAAESMVCAGGRSICPFGHFADRWSTGESHLHSQVGCPPGRTFWKSEKRGHRETSRFVLVGVAVILVPAAAAQAAPAAAARAAAAFSVPASADAGAPVGFTYRFRGVSSADRLVVHRQEGTAHGWRTVRTFHTRAGGSSLPGLPLGSYEVRAAAVAPGRGCGPPGGPERQGVRPGAAVDADVGSAYSDFQRRHQRHVFGGGGWVSGVNALVGVRLRSSSDASAWCPGAPVRADRPSILPRPSYGLSAR